MRLNGFQFSRSARLALTQIVTESEKRFGSDARRRYEDLVIQAIRDLVEDPERLGTRTVGPRIHYHLRHSRGRVIGSQVRNPRHLLVVRIVGEELFVAAVVHDARVEGVKGRIDEGEAE